MDNYSAILLIDSYFQPIFTVLILTVSMQLKKVWIKILPFVKNKFILTIIVFVVWMLIFDQSNWIDMASEVRKIHKLEQEKDYYIKKIETDKTKLKELKTNNENLEKFAREQYLMKKPDEDIFIIEE